MAQNNVFQMLAQQELDRPERELRQLQLKTLMDEAKYKEQSRADLAAMPNTTTATSTLGSMAPQGQPFNPVAGPQMASMDPNAQGRTLSSLGLNINPMQKTEEKPLTLAQKYEQVYNYHMSQGREDEAQKILDHQLEFTGKAAKLADSVLETYGAEGLKQWHKENPKWGSLLGDPENIQVTPEGVLRPMKNADGTPSDRYFSVADRKGKITVIDKKPQPVQTFAPGVGIPDGKGGYTVPVPKEDKLEYKFRERTDGGRTIAEESQDSGKTWKKVSEGPRYKPAGAGGSEPVAQTTFVDPESGKPLVFDKTTGSYRVANVEGGVAPKPGAMSPEQATRAQQLETIATNIPKIRDMVLDGNGNIISKLDIANSQIGTWGTKGREIRQAVKRTVEQALRIATGAAAPDSEVASYTEMYAPQVGDTKDMIAEKFRALEIFAEGTRAKFNVGRSAEAINRGNGKVKANAQPEQGQTEKGGSYADLLNKHKR